MQASSAKPPQSGGVRPMRVLVASDGSERAAVVIDLVAAIDWPPGTLIELVGAVESSVMRFGGAWPTDLAFDTVRLDDQMRQLLEQQLAQSRDRLARPGIEVRSSVELGRAADVILERAADAGPDLIVVGSRGHGALESMLLGSVSSEVIDHASAPVLVARRPGIGRIVLAWDGSSSAELAARTLTDWPIFASADVRIVSVADSAPPHWLGPGFTNWEGASIAYEEAAAAYEQASEPSRSQHEQLARDMSQRLVGAGLRAEPDVRAGEPAGQVVAAAESWEADLIVMGTHGRTGLRRLMLGSVARNVLHEAPCSVLVVREPREADTSAADDAGERPEDGGVEPLT